MKSLVRNPALAVAMLALVLSFTGLAEAARDAVVAKLRPGAPVRVGPKGKIPPRVLPFAVKRGIVVRARRADRLGRRPAAAYVDRCPGDTVDLGTWCLATAANSLDRGEIGRNDYLFAVKACASRGGYLPSAAELISAADEVKLAGTIDDSPVTASIDEDPTDGLKDRREMSATLVTTAAGGTASGSVGVTKGSKGDPRQGEPDPTPLPRDPEPDTLQYVTVFDNGNRGGFAGSKPVSQPESFRCAFNKAQPGAAVEVE